MEHGHWLELSEETFRKEQKLRSLEICMRLKAILCMHVLQNMLADNRNPVVLEKAWLKGDRLTET